MSKRLILIFQKPSLAEVAPSLKGGCRGFKGPVPQPLWIRTSYSVVERNYKAGGTFVKIFVPEDATRTRLMLGDALGLSLETVRHDLVLQTRTTDRSALFDFGAILHEQLT